jgi:hypothetical protein
MARIRSIKPEFPHSESMGRVSRDARLTFIELWTLADDAGRLRGNSRMLASLLFPYDDDAPGLIDKWMAELERESCVVRYQIDGTNYVQICNWLTHQKIDKPSQSKIPEFDEASRIVARPRERSSGDQGLDQGSRIKEGIKDQSTSTSSTAVAEVFDFWKTEVGHPKAQLDRKRKARIVDALKKFSVEELRNCIKGYTFSPHHMGTDPKGNGVRYDDIELFLRDAQHVESGLRFYAHPPRPPPKPIELSPVERVMRANGLTGGNDERVVSEQRNGTSEGLGDIFGDVRGPPHAGLRRISS